MEGGKGYSAESEGATQGTDWELNQEKTFQTSMNEDRILRGNSVVMMLQKGWKGKNKDWEEVMTILLMKNVIHCLGESWRGRERWVNGENWSIGLLKYQRKESVWCEERKATVPSVGLLLKWINPSSYEK